MHYDYDYVDLCFVIVIIVGVGVVIMIPCQVGFGVGLRTKGCREAVDFFSLPAYKGCRAVWQIVWVKPVLYAAMSFGTRWRIWSVEAQNIMMMSIHGGKGFGKVFLD